MATLPPELLRLIVSQVALSYLYYPDTNQYKKDLGTLRALRLANYSLSSLASCHLFEEVTVYFTEASHAKMMAIARHPTYSLCVRSLLIGPRAIFGPYLDRDDFGLWVDDARPLAEKKGSSVGWLSLGPPRKECVHMKEAQVIDFHHAEYTSFYEKQEQLLKNAGDYLKTAIIRFSCLEEVGPSTRTPRMACSVPSTDDHFMAEQLLNPVSLNVYDVDHAAIILRAVSLGQDVARTSIDIGRMFSVMDTMIINRPNLRKHIEILVPNVRNLEFSLKTFEPSEWRQFFVKGRCRSFLSSMTMLDSLRCSTFGHGDGTALFPTIPHIFGDNTWQNLSRLELSRFYTNAGELSSLLGRHRSTLQTLILQHIKLLHGSWLNVFITLRGAALGVVKVYHLTEDYHLTRAYDTTGAYAPTWAYDPRYFSDDIVELHFDQIASSDSLDAFLFRGGSWGSHMNRELESLGLEQNIDLKEDETEEQITPNQGTAPISQTDLSFPAFVPTWPNNSSGHNEST